MSRVSADEFRILLEAAPDGFFVHDEEGHILDVNARSCADLGYPRAELLTRTILDIVGGVDADEIRTRWRETRPGTSLNFQEIATRKDGSTFPVEISMTCQIVDGRKLFLGLARDVSEREAARAAIERAHGELEARIEQRTAELRAAYERMEVAARVGGLGIWDYDIAADVMHCDEQWYRIMRRDPVAPICTLAEFRAIIHPDDADRATEIDETARELLASDADYGIVFRIVRPNGEWRWVRSAGSVIADSGGTPRRAVGFVIDITEAWLAEASLQRQTLEDPLTGAANRRRLDDALEKACLQATRSGEPLSLAMFDVDHFKAYNDSHGHLAGDMALMAVVDILTGAARRPYDLVARYGGEEFMLMLPGVDQPETVLDIIRAELAARAIPHPTSPTAPHLTVSCGCIVISELADVDPRSLFDHCDRLLYQAKETGRNRVVIARL